jgi:hypothetical protein
MYTYCMHIFSVVEPESQGAATFDRRRYIEVSATALGSGSV